MRQTDLGVLRTEALRVSKNIVKAELKAKGIRLSELRLSELNAMAKEHLVLHREELIGRALGSLAWSRLCDQFHKLELMERRANVQSTDTFAFHKSEFRKCG